jgi:hypothetical protein
MKAMLLKDRGGFYELLQAVIYKQISAEVIINLYVYAGFIYVCK